MANVDVKGTNECFALLALRTKMMDQRINFIVYVHTIHAVCNG